MFLFYQNDKNGLSNWTARILYGILYDCNSIVSVKDVPVMLPCPSALTQPTPLAYQYVYEPEYEAGTEMPCTLMVKVMLVFTCTFVAWKLQAGTLIDSSPNILNAVCALPSALACLPDIYILPSKSSECPHSSLGFITVGIETPST